MSRRSSWRLYRQVMVANALLALALAAVAWAAPAAHASVYKMVACAANNGTAPYTTSTNTISSTHPAGIFDFNNWCGGAGGDPPGEAAYLRINEHEASGNAGQWAYGSMNFQTPAYVHFMATGGYTREAYAFNDGWRARFWSPDANVEFLLQGSGAPTPTSATFGPHLWPFGYYLGYRRFTFELLCVRAAGCDRANYNSVDANGFVFILADESDSTVAFTNTGSALMQGQWVTGAQNVTFNVADQGSGIRWERMRVDGAQRWAWDHGPECNVSSSQTNGEWARSYQPCPVGGPWGRSVALDTASLADGAHNLQLCTQDYGQYQGLNGSGSESCAARTIHVDNTAPGAPVGLRVTSENPQRYLDHFGAQLSLPSDPGSPIAKLHYDIVDADGTVVTPARTVSGTNPTEIANIEGPKHAGDYRLRLWLEDSVGHLGPAAIAPIPHDTTPPAAPQGLQVATPSTSRVAQGFDLRWRNIVDGGSPIVAAHYEVLNGVGRTVAPSEKVTGEGIQAIQDLDAPDGRGSYTLRLWLEDGEGNVGAPVSAPLAYDCVRSDVPGGLSLSADFKGSDTVTVRQGAGAVLSGSLQAPGGGLAGAPVCVFSSVVTDPGREFLGVALTDTSGGYRFALAPGPSRELTAIYRPDQRQLEAQATLQTRVRPTLRVRRRIVRNGKVARFYGHIPGPHNDRVVVVLQVRSGQGWRAFRRYRTRAGGRFAVGYRFTRTVAATRYVMRAQVRSTTGYPYLQGNSRALRIRVIPGRHG